MSPCASRRRATMSDVFPFCMPAVRPRRSAVELTWGVSRRLTAMPWLNRKYGRENRKEQANAAPVHMRHATILAGHGASITAEALPLDSPHEPLRGSFFHGRRSHRGRSSAPGAGWIGKSRSGLSLRSARGSTSQTGSSPQSSASSGFTGFQSAGVVPKGMAEALRSVMQLRGSPR